MMKTMKKTAAVLISAVMALSLMAGCSEDEGTPVPMNKLGSSTVTTSDGETTTTTTTSESESTTTSETTTTTTSETTTTTTSETTTTTTSETTAETTTSAQDTTTKLSSVIPDITQSVNAQLNTAFRTEYDAKLAVAAANGWAISKEQVLKNTDTEYGVYVCYSIRKTAIQSTVLPGVYKVTFENNLPVVKFYQVTGVKNTTVSTYEKYTVPLKSSIMDTVFKTYGKSSQTTTTTTKKAQVV